MFEAEVGLSIYPGERMGLSGQFELMRLASGFCELYAEDALTGRQLFLMELKAGDSVFPINDENVSIFVYAVEESRLCPANPTDYDEQELGHLLRHWYRKLFDISFISREALKSREALAYWEGMQEKISSMKYEELVCLWQDKQKVLAGRLRRHFDFLQQSKEAMVDKAADYRRQLLDASINNLLQQEVIERRDEDGKQQERVAFIVRTVAKALEMPLENIHISPELAGKLDQLGLIKRLVQKGNMTMRLVSLSGDWYRKDCGVLIGYVGEEKALVALVPESEARYRMYSYEQPDGVPVDSSLAAEIDSDGFQCYAGFPARKLKIRDLLVFMFRHCWKRDYQAIILCSLAAGIIPLVSPIITETIFSDIIPIRDHVSLAAVTQIMLLTGFTTAALSLVRSIAVLRITNHLDMAVEAALWGRLLQLPAKFFRRFETGELLQRMNGIEAIKSMATGQFVGQIFNFVFSFWSIGLMLWYSWKLTLEALAVWGIYFVVVAFIYRRLINFQREMLKAANRTAGLLQQIFTGLAKFRVHGAEPQAFYLWSRVFGVEWKWKMKLRWQGNYNGIIGAVQPFILNMLLYYTAMYGMQETTSTGQVVQHIGYSQFLAFQAAFSAFNGTVVGIVPLVAQFFTIKPHIDNLRPILDEVPEVTEDKLDADVLTGAVKIEHLTFSYGDDLPDVLKDISLEIRAGENVAIVGRSGCGKSTLLRLLLGMEVPKRGVIYYDYQDMQDLNLASVRCQLGVVLQNGQLMTGDIYTNIVGTSPLTMDDAWEAAEMAGIADDIRAMPMGMHTIISEGSGNISGGQRQRILIARAIAGRPAIIMLDEATSALDNRTQAIVTESLNRMKATRIIIAHRLSTIREAERIVVIDDGRVAEQGSFEELMEMDGMFAQLARRQLA
ncbi:NHLP bacteriocin export ABC transporter permease/ATPase subunit [Anaerovibrio sp.]|uniref:NHLP bacteriocin export ABC transporter permease/ATPase subunit n=1 Tax=Anaerovibrio sp. TaxID=1872532 RepID=UPI003F1816D2